MHLLRHISNLGYGSRKEVERMIRQGAVTDDQGVVLKEGDRRPHESIRVHGEELDPPFPLTLMLHKPDGYTCSMDDPGAIIYDLLPERFAHRKPQLNPIGRLDKDTTGLLLLTDDGKLLHKVIHPKSGCRKIYHASLDRPLQGHEAGLFASGTLLLNGETKPLLPATLEVLGPKEALISLHEGRYHQVRRMFAAAGNHVSTLKRISIGGLKLPEELAEGEWKIVEEAELKALFGD